MANRYTIVHIPGLKRSDLRRIVFLRAADQDETTAEAAFDGLNPKKRRELLARFDHWIDGGTCDAYFHGWPNDPDRKGCWVFKWADQQHQHRLYGFLCNPLPRSNPRFLLCVLVLHATKNQWRTDGADLDRVIRLCAKAGVKAAIASAFPDAKRSTSTWVN